MRWAPLLPKLRGHFAEFLGSASPAGLGVLPPSTCVGLRYGCTAVNSGFSWHRACMLRYYLSLRLTPPACAHVLPVRASCACAGRSAPGSCPAPCVPAVLLPCSAGISTCCPSATRPRLALGPDLPRADQLYPGNLGYSAKGIPTPFSLLIPAFSLPGAPPRLTARLPRPGDAPLPVHIRAPLSFGAVFQPRTFSAQGFSTSELLRTL